MKLATNLTLVEPSPPVDIAKQWREEIRQRDWKRVHLEGDRNPPVSIGRRIWCYTFPTSRKGKS